jgi:hypothetical protein
VTDRQTQEQDQRPLAAAESDAAQEAVSMVQAGANRIEGDSISMSQSGAGVIRGGQITVDQGGAFAIVGDRIDVREGGAAVLLAREVSGQPVVLLDWRSVVALVGGLLLLKLLFRGRR